MALAPIVAEGSRRRSLEALRDFLAAQLDIGLYPPAPIAQRLTEVLREIDSLPVEGQVTTVDAIAARRAARRSKTANL